MCGFCGFTGSNPTHAKSIIESMIDTITHRGPDSVGTYLNDKITLGFSRLGTVALENGTQPMHNKTNTLALVFNGEIYNFNELRTLLEEKEHTFKTLSDTETLLHLYEEYGIGMLSHLRGMFAFAIYDAVEDKLFCARDQFGIKPFYYTRANDQLIFGSEIKSFFQHPDFVPTVNTEALGQYLTFQYSVLEETFFKGVYKLPPGHYLIWQDSNVKISRYNSHLFTPAEMSLNDAVESINNAVCESVKKHVESCSVEVGSFLSGGVDSGYMAATFGGGKNNKTFTVGFDYEKYNEIGHAQSLSNALGLENISKIISTEEYWESLPQIQYHMDEPLADPAAVAFYFASREAAKHVRVALSGEGADEFFGGYNIYKEPISLRFYSLLPISLREWIASLAKKLPQGTRGRSFLMRGAKPVEERFFGNAFIFSAEERDKFLKTTTIQSPTDITRPYYNQVKHEDDITKMQFLDINLWLVGDILLQADKMSMAHGLEVRTPLLDREVFRVASRLPVKHRVSRKGTKIAFRLAAAKHLPKETANRRKLGFPVPIRIWLREEKYHNIVKSHFASATAEKYFHTEELTRLIDEHYTGKHDNSRKIWTIYMFLLWHKEFFPEI